jgi:hypothetical protein
MVITVRQADTKHHPNKLHDHLIAQGLPPSVVMATPEETSLTYPDSVSVQSVRAAIGSYQFKPEVKIDHRKRIADAVAAHRSASPVAAKTAQEEVNAAILDYLKERGL